MKSDIGTGIIVVMLTGVVTNALASWREISVQATMIKNVEEKHRTHSVKVKSLEEKIDDIHWHLIGSKGKSNVNGN